jgi:hypothetical protein
MILDAKSGVRGVLVNADTGQPIRWARWANLATGEYEAFRLDPAQARMVGVPPRLLIYRGMANLRFIESHVQLPSRPSPAPADVPPEELTNRPLLKRTTERCLEVPGRECDEPRCHALARWRVGHEQELPPVEGENGRLFERAATVAENYYCDKHYRNPTFTTLRGVQREVEVAARPQ